MIIDIGTLAIIVFFLLLGILSGFIKQVVRIVALVGAFVLVSPIAVLIRECMAETVPMEKFPGNLLALLVAWLLGYLAILLAGAIVVRIVRRSSEGMSAQDRILGGVVGTLKAGMIAYFLVCGLLLLEDPLGKHVPELPVELEASRVAVIVREHNLLKGLDLSWERAFFYTPAGSPPPEHKP